MYEDYWKFTAAWTDIYGVKFNNALSIIINYIDKYGYKLNSIKDLKKDFKKSDYYGNLQNKIVKAMGFVGNDASLSARKGINLFVKLGFIYPYLSGYHKLAKKFLLEKDEDKKITFSKIFYESSSLASDVTKDNRQLKHISFFLRTLDVNKKLSKQDVIALMVTDITQFPDGYLKKSELESQYNFAVANEFDERKYNQISHLTSFLKNFVDLKYDTNKEIFMFADDPEVVSDEIDISVKRDPIKHRIFRNELIRESVSLYGKKVCFLTKKPYKGLVASHIKPFHICMKERNEDEAYDVNNGLLLCQNVDQYFNDFDVTFTDKGEQVYKKDIDDEIKREFNSFKLDKEILNDSRKIYLKYHQKVFSERNKVEL